MQARRSHGERQLDGVGGAHRVLAFSLAFWALQCEGQTLEILRKLLRALQWKLGSRAFEAFRPVIETGALGLQRLPPGNKNWAHVSPPRRNKAGGAPGLRGRRPRRSRGSRTQSAGQESPLEESQEPTSHHLSLDLSAPECRARGGGLQENGWPANQHPPAPPFKTPTTFP